MTTLENKFTYEGRTLKSLREELAYINERLSSNNLETWEVKEYESVKKECLYKIKDIEKRIELFNN